MARSKKKKAVKPGTNVPPGTFWMIQNPEGKFSDGSDCPHFTTVRPRRWETHGQLLAHLTRINRNRERQAERAARQPAYYIAPGEHPYKDCKVVQFLSVEQESCSVIGYGE